MIEYKIREFSVLELDLPSGEHVIAVKFNDTPFAGAVFSVDFARFEGTEENPVLKFKYTILEGALDCSEFRNEVGDLIMGLAQKQLNEGYLVMAGSGDEEVLPEFVEDKDD